MSLRSWLFLRRHHHSCNRTIASARELARIGHEKRHAKKLALARRIREELGLEPDGRLV
jgi:hypothetical protein